MGAGASLADQLLRSGVVPLDDGSETKLSSGIDETCGAFLRAQTLQTRPAVAVEVGLAYGISTLYMLDALAEIGAGRLIGMDPAQHDSTWRGGGLRNVRTAGLEDYYEFHEESSQAVLPRLVREGIRAQLGFIDGWHTFDHTLVDFFYLDQLLDTGGVLVFDDVGYPAIHRVCDFVVTNRSYELIGGVRLPPGTTSPMRTALKRLAIKALGPLVRTDQTPGSPARAAELSFDGMSFAAFRKISEDRRRFDHFVPF